MDASLKWYFNTSTVAHRGRWGRPPHQNPSVSCEQKDIDRYKRIVAVCSVKGVDLNACMVQEGLALAYRQYGTEYIAQENDARKA
jgi:endonuclease YncB( thermonuclease family)